MNLKPSLGYIKDTGTPKGRGVFASRAIAQDEIIEICPVVQLTKKYKKLPEELKQMVFHWGSLAEMAGISAVALGYGSMYNHANPANTRYSASDDGANLIFVAVVAIGKDEEITINYNAGAGAPVSSEDNWFKNMGILPFKADAASSLAEQAASPSGL